MATTRYACAMIALSATLAAGCASNPVPEVELAQARVAIAKAELAPSEPGAHDLALAREKLALAQRWVQARDNLPASWLAQQAKVDPELSYVKASGRGAR